MAYPELKSRMNNEPSTYNQSDASGQSPNTMVGQLVESTLVPVIEEQLQVGTQRVQTGVVRIVKHVTEEVQTVSLPTTREDVIVDRVAIYQYVETPPAVRYEGDTTIIPVLREVLVTEKKLLLVEEVHITKRRTTDQDAQEFTLLKEEVTVERSGPDNERSA